MSNQWLTLQYVSVVLLSLTVVALYYLPESPKFLLSVGKTDEALQTLNWIAKFNGFTELPEEVTK